MLDLALITIGINLDHIYKTSDHWKGLGLKLHAMISIIYTSCTIQIPWGLNKGYYIPHPLTTTLSLVLYKIEQKCYTGTTLSASQN